MPRLILPVPEPVRTYLGDAAMAESINHLVKADDAVPVDLTWEEVVPFHEARLAAEAVRLALLRFYEQIWDAVWDPALGRHGRIGFDRLQRRQHQWTLPSLEVIWTDCLYRIVRADPDKDDTEDNWLYASVGNDADENADKPETVLHIWLGLDTSDALRRHFPDGMPDGWSPVDEDGWSEMTPPARYAQDYSDIDLTDAAAAAGRLVAAFRGS